MIWIKESLRWMLAAAAVTAAVFAALYFNLFVLFFVPFPQDVAEPTVGFLLGSLVVLTGSTVAPRHRFVTAVVLFLLGLYLSIFVLHFHFVGALVGGLFAVGLIGWRLHPQRSTRSTVWVGGALGAAFFVFIGLVYCRYIDWPARPDPLPSELTHTLGDSDLHITAFYQYDLGGFIDQEYLWRIDAKPDAIALVVNDFELQSASAVSQRFWRLPPHYWPRSMPTDAEAFQSPAFSADSRGPDGFHYFMVHDQTQEKAFVWFKSNF